MVGIPESIIGTIISTMAKPIFQSIWEGSGQLVGKVGEQTQQLIFSASQQYEHNYQERHGLVRALGMRESIPLDRIYTTVKFLVEEELGGFESVATLEEQYRNDRARRLTSKKRPKRSGLTVANKEQYLMVLGGPGAGKSTFLRRMGWEALKGSKKGEFKYACIPVLIELKDFRTDPIDLEGKIAEEFEICGFPEHQRFTEAALKQGKLLILLDGLDELPSARLTDAIDKIQDFVDRHSKNRFIASCRIAAYRNNLRRFTDVAIAEFDDEQIQYFINNWFHSQPDRAQDCWQKLASKEYAAAKELVHTPLLLTLICLLYQRAGRFPTNRATLYEKALRVLLEEWAGEKNIPQEQIYKGLDTKRKELMLAKIAHDALQHNRLFLPKRDIASQIEDILKDMLPDEKFIDGSAVLKSIEVQHGVMVERVDSIYSFSHLTIQEFLTALYINEHHQIETLVTQHLTDTRWREVLLLVAGLMGGGADGLLLQIERQTQAHVQSTKLQMLLRWATQMTTDLEDGYQPTTERAILVFFAFAFAIDCHDGVNGTFNPVPVLARALGRACDRQRPFNPTDGRDIVRAEALALTRDTSFDRDRDPSLDRDLVVARILTKLGVIRPENRPRLLANLERFKVQLPDTNPSQQIRQIWFEALQLPPDLISFSANELKALNYFLSTSLLMVQCKEAAVVVSRKTWAEIETRILKGLSRDQGKKVPDDLESLSGESLEEAMIG